MLKCDICGREVEPSSTWRMSIKQALPRVVGEEAFSESVSSLDVAAFDAAFDICGECSSKILGQHYGPARLVDIAKGLLIRAFGDTVA